MAVNVLIRFASAEEKKKVDLLAKKARLSFSNYVRQRLDLEPLAHGGPRPNGPKADAKRTRNGRKADAKKP